MATRRNGRDRLNRWLVEQGFSRADLGKEVGDHMGYQIGKWLNRERDRLPIKLATRVSRTTGIPLVMLLDDDDRELAQAIVALMARDAA